MTTTIRQQFGQDGDIRILAHTQKHCVARICGVGEGTVRRWRRENIFPEYARRLIAIEAGYFTWPAFDGWQVIGNKLYSPSLCNGFTASDIEMLPWLVDQVKHLERLNAAPAQYLLNI